MEAIEHPPIFMLPGIPAHVTYTWVVMVILTVLAFAASRNLQLVPRGLQNFMELVLEQFLTLLDEVIGHEGRRYLPLVGTLGLFILVSNLMGLVPGLMAPTSNLNTTAACAVTVFFTYHWIGIRKQGLGAYLRHLCGPVLWLAPLMFVIEIFSHLARPLSLSVRLFGNMMGGHILLAVIFLLTGLDGLLGWVLTGKLAALLMGLPGAVLLVAFTVGFLLPLKLFVAFLQTFIFCMLSMLYIAGAVEEAEHH
ncbi:MAG: F0F1 ATP synthase subunit A [Candidatus Rokubacteria bacterium]|nr:F0F1 ATP synthase subunit A [Candidatus Rokubacteria bacterium]